MATEAAEIIPESLSLTKTEEVMEPCDKAVEKKLQGDIVQTTETVECLATTNGVETINAVSEGNLEVPKGESFSISPEKSEVAKQTCVISEKSEFDEAPVKAEKIEEDEEKKAIDEEAKTGGNEGTKADEASDPTSSSLEKANGTVEEGQEEKSFKEVKDTDTEPEKLPAQVEKEEGKEAVAESCETSGTEKDQITSGDIGDTSTSKVAESLETKEGDEAAVAKVDEKLQEVSCVVTEDKSQAAIESSEEIKHVKDENEEISITATPIEKVEEEVKNAETKHESVEDSSEQKTTEDVCLHKEEERVPNEAEAVKEKEETAALPSEERKLGTGTIGEEIQEPEGVKEDETAVAAAAAEAPKVEEPNSEVEEEKEKEVEIPEMENPQEPDTSVDQDVAQASITEKSLDIEATTTVEKLNEEKGEDQKENEKCDDSSARGTKDICLQKEEPNEVDNTKEEKVKESQAVSEGETVASRVIAEESQEDGTLTEENQIKEAETPEVEITPQLECPEVELQGAIEDGATAAAPQTLPEEKPADQLHVITSKLPSEVQVDQTKETELQEEVTDSVPKETESNEAPKEDQVMEDKEVTETSSSIPQSEETTKVGSGEDELKDKLMEEKTRKAVETTCQTEELAVEAPKASENEIIEKQIIFEDKTVEDTDQASVAETETVKKEEASTELAQAEGSKDLADGYEINEGNIQKPEETTNTASEKQVPRAFYPISITEISSPVESQDLAAETLEKAEVGEKTTDNSGEEITKESTSMDDSTESSSNHVEISTKEILQVTQDMTEEREAKDETDAAQVLLEEKYLAPSFELPTEEEHKVTSKVVDAAEEKELKEVETVDKDSSDSKTGEEICLDKEENKELEAVVEQETNSLQFPPTEIKEDSASQLEDGRKEVELKEEPVADKTNETLKVPTNETQIKEDSVSQFEDGREEDEIKEEHVADKTNETQNEVLSMETVKDIANNVEKETVVENKTVQNLEQASVGTKEAITVQDRALETSEKPEVRNLEPEKAREICSDAGVDQGGEKNTDDTSVEINKEPATADSGKLSLSDLLQKATDEKIQAVERDIVERDLTVGKEEPEPEEENIQVKEAKTDEEKDGDGGVEDNNKTDSGSDAAVIVEAPRDAETKSHKKSHNILSGVGLKVKNSISKVKKAITGKSSSKESKPISPKESEK